MEIFRRLLVVMHWGGERLLDVNIKGKQKLPNNKYFNKNLLWVLPPYRLWQTKIDAETHLDSTEKVACPIVISTEVSEDILSWVYFKGRTNRISL